jgi:hypothetical protein
MQANIKVLSKKTEIQDLLSQICISVPDCEKFEMDLVSPPYVSVSVMFLIIIAGRDLIEEILEIVNTATLDKVETVISSNSESKTQVEFEPFGMP